MSDDLAPLLKRLHLANTRHTWRDLVQRAEKEECAYERFFSRSSPKKSRIVAARVSRAPCVALHFRFFALSKNSTSATSPRFDSRRSARFSPPTSSPRAAPSFSNASPVAARRISPSHSRIALSKTVRRALHHGCGADRRALVSESRRAHARSARSLHQAARACRR